MDFFEQTTQNKNNTIWCERYRPTTMDNFIGNEHLKQKLRKYIETGDVPHLLLHGKPGSGKTSIAKLLINMIDCDFLFINASDENNVDTMRNKIKGFASTVGFSPIKIIVLDEADNLSISGAQPILRNMMETFSQHCRFILTCNYVDKIIEPLQSRCQSFQIIPPSKREIAVHVANILQNEGVTFEPKDLVPIIDANYPDIRKIINTVQLGSHEGVLRVDTEAILENDYRQRVVDILCSSDTPKNKYTKCRQAIIDSRAQDFTDLFSLLYEKVDSYAGNNTANVIILLGDAVAKSPLVVDKEIIAAATVISIINALQQ